jgi:hypothetical protein
MERHVRPWDATPGDWRSMVNVALHGGGGATPTDPRPCLDRWRIAESLRAGEAPAETGPDWAGRGSDPRHPTPPPVRNAIVRRSKSPFALPLDCTAGRVYPARMGDRDRSPITR